MHENLLEQDTNLVHVYLGEEFYSKPSHNQFLWTKDLSETRIIVSKAKMQLRHLGILDTTTGTYYICNASDRGKSKIASYLRNKSDPALISLHSLLSTLQEYKAEAYRIFRLACPLQHPLCSIVDIRKSPV